MVVLATLGANLTTTGVRSATRVSPLPLENNVMGASERRCNKRARHNKLSQTDGVNRSSGRCVMRGYKHVEELRR